MNDDESPAETDAEERDLDELCNRIVAGSEFPSLNDLLRGCPFYKNDIWADAGAFAYMVMNRLVALEGQERLLSAMAELTIKPGSAEYLDAADQLKLAMGTVAEKAVRATSMRFVRCHLYAAVSGYAKSNQVIVGYTASRILPDSPVEKQSRLRLQEAKAWGRAARGEILVPRQWTRVSAAAFLATSETPVNRDALSGSHSTERRPSVFQRAKADAPETPQQAEVAIVPGELDEVVDNDDPEKDRIPSVIVVTTVGNSQSVEGKRVTREFKTLIGNAVRLVTLPDLSRVRSELAAEFPHAAGVADRILGSMASAKHVRLQPTVLVGPPGSGKSSFVVRLTDLLGVPSEVFPCGGVSDSSLAGTSRRWSTGEPCIPLSLVLTHECASPAIILDEIEKVGTSRHNGSLLDALLGLLEPQTAARWRDPYIEAPVDLSHVVWLATANSLEGISRPLLDRFRVIAFPSPGAEHITALATGICRRFAEYRDVDPRWIRPLDGVELNVLSKTWADGSIRTLARLISVVLSARERFDACH